MSELFDNASFVEQVLGRKQIGGDDRAADAFLARQRILVTGAAGSIGSALTDYLVGLRPHSLILLDHHENSLFQMRQRLGQRSGGIDDSMHFILADVRNRRRIASVLRQYSPDVVFHLAAYKHVPLAEESPEEFVSINVLGAWHLLQEARAAGVKRIVYPSTDKAVNPPSIYGATKRIVETMFQAFATEEPRVQLSVVRLVNVLGAHGGVIEIFARQVAEGRELTVTDPKMIRYWITMQEAIYLLTRTAYAGNSGGITILDLGRPLTVLEIAQRVWQSLGPKGMEMPVRYVGMRPGERLVEDLTYAGEYTARAASEGLLEVEREIPRRYEVAQLAEIVATLGGLVDSENLGELRDRLFSYLSDLNEGLGSPLP